jgi:hypothetical protein
VLRRLNALQGFAVRASDGEVGTVHDFYFDDEHWTVRYLVVDTGVWLGRRVLVSPVSLRRPDWSRRSFEVAVTRSQIEAGPTADLHQPVSRQYETAYASYYGYSPYWSAPGVWPAAAYPGMYADPPVAYARDAAERDAMTAQATGGAEDRHLRSVREVTGYHLRAEDGEIGHVDDFLADEDRWQIRYLDVDTSNWIGGRSVAIPRRSLARINWADRTLGVRLTRAQVEHSPRVEALGDAVRELDDYYQRLWSGVPS